MATWHPGFVTSLVDHCGILPNPLACFHSKHAVFGCWLPSRAHDGRTTRWTPCFPPPKTLQV